MNCQHAFDQLMEAFISQHVLLYPDPIQLYQLVADTSLLAYGAVLSQEGPDNNWYLVAYLSELFLSPEWNYDMHNCKLLTIIKVLEY